MSTAAGSRNEPLPLSDSDQSQARRLNKHNLKIPVPQPSSSESEDGVVDDDDDDDVEIVSVTRQPYSLASAFNTPTADTFNVTASTPSGKAPSLEDAATPKVGQPAGQAEPGAEVPASPTRGPLSKSARRKAKKNRQKEAKKKQLEDANGEILSAANGLPSRGNSVSSIASELSNDDGEMLKYPKQRNDSGRSASSSSSNSANSNSVSRLVSNFEQQISNVSSSSVRSRSRSMTRSASAASVGDLADLPTPGKIPALPRMPSSNSISSLKSELFNNNEDPGSYRASTRSASRQHDSSVTSISQQWMDRVQSNESHTASGPIHRAEVISIGNSGVVRSRKSSLSSVKSNRSGHSIGTAAGPAPPIPKDVLERYTASENMSRSASQTFGNSNHNSPSVGSSNSNPWLDKTPIELEEAAVMNAPVGPVEAVGPVESAPSTESTDPADRATSVESQTSEFDSDSKSERTSSAHHTSFASSPGAVELPHLSMEPLDPSASLASPIHFDDDSRRGEVPKRSSSLENRQHVVNPLDKISDDAHALEKEFSRDDAKYNKPLPAAPAKRITSPLASRNSRKPIKSFLPIESTHRHSMSSFISSSSKSDEQPPVDNEGVIYAVCLVNFHHHRGPEVEYWVGEKGDESHRWPYLPFQGLPDGAHSHEENFCYFTLLDDYEKDKERTLFGISCNRQLSVSELEHVSSDVTRSTIQKSIVVVARKPMFGPIKEKLDLTTRAYFLQENLEDFRILDNLYDNLKQIFAAPLKEDELAVGMPLRDLLHSMKSKLLIILKCLLLEKKILFYSSDTDKLCSSQFSVVSLIPNLMNNLDDCASPTLNSYEKSLQKPTSLRTSDRNSYLRFMGLPLQIFSKGGFFNPYIPLQQLDELTNPETKFFLVGTTNSLILSKKESLVDMVFDIDQNKLEVINPVLNCATSLSSQETKWINTIVSVVERTRQQETYQFEGGEDYIRVQFEDYILNLVSSIKYDTFLKEHKGPIFARDIQGNPAASYNLTWIAEWQKTRNYEIFNNFTDGELFDILVPKVLQPPQSEILAKDTISKSVGRALNEFWSAQVAKQQAYQAERAERAAAAAAAAEKDDQTAPEGDKVDENETASPPEEQKERQLSPSSTADSRGVRSSVVSAAESVHSRDSNGTLASVTSTGQQPQEGYFASWGRWAKQKVEERAAVRAQAQAQAKAEAEAQARMAQVDKEMSP